MTTLAFLALGLPLGAFVTLALLPVPRRVVAVVAPAVVAAAFACGLGLLSGVLDRSLAERSSRATVDGWAFVQAGSFRFDVTLYVDQLSVFMTLIVTGVGALIVTYATGYMSDYDDRAYRRFFAYMCFFVFAMLLLVLGDGFFFLLVGWGLVGLASYLLIGFDRERPAAVAAARKAFVMNAIGDVGLALAAFFIFWTLGTLSYAQVFVASGSLSEGQVTAITLLLLLAAVAKSGQIPLQTWLPDAMEGPTPVSALIHAATMVTAGVYLIVRCAPLFEAAPSTQIVVGAIGTATLLLGSLAAIAQVDLKRSLAYSTVAQIGYMFVATSVGAYGAAMFHLLTHAFFKALLFLCAGTVIHALHGEQSLDRMGGLRRAMPQTALLFTIGAAALAGLPLFSGYFSKDEILAASLHSGGVAIVWYVGMLLAALLTAIYSFRLVLRVFYGEPAEGRPEPHGEGGLSMRVPLVVLGAGALLAGFVQVPGITHVVNEWLDPAVFGLAAAEPSDGLAWVSLAVGAAVAILGVLVALRVWPSGSTARSARIGAANPGLAATLAHAFWFNELYDAIAVRPASALGRGLRTVGERFVGEGLMGGGAAVAVAAGQRSRSTQRGLVRVSTSIFAVGIAAALGYLLIRSAT